MTTDNNTPSDDTEIKNYTINLTATGNSFAAGNYTINALTGFNGVITGALHPHYPSNLTVSNPYTLNTSTLDEKNSGLLTIKGENADIDLNGKSLKTWMELVEKRLAILQPNTALESEWEELKILGDRYRQLEQEIKEKMQAWDILRKEQ